MIDVGRKSCSPWWNILKLEWLHTLPETKEGTSSKKINVVFLHLTSKLNTLLSSQKPTITQSWVNGCEMLTCSFALAKILTCSIQGTQYYIIYVVVL